jgi:acetyl-CoA acyltransferase
VLREIVERNGVDPALVEDVIMGCVMQVGEQGINIGRNAALAAGFPETTVGTTIDRQCGSSQQAAHFAAQGVMAGAYDVVIAAGVENMTRVPMGASVADGKYGFPFGPMMTGRYPNLVPQGISAELIAEKWGISREDNDAFSVESHLRAARATEEGRFDREILPITITDRRRRRDDDARRGHPARLHDRDARQAQAGVQGRRRGHRRRTRRRSPTARPRCSS